MIETIIIGGALLIGGGATVGWLSSMIMNVKEKQEVLLESFGKYTGTVKNAGLRFKAPWPFATVANKVSTALLEMKEDLGTKTKDDIFVTLPIKMHLQVSDTKKFHYESADPVRQVMSRVAQAIKQLTSNMDFAELYQARETISDQAREKVGKEISELYGMTLVDVIVDEPHAPAEIQQSYNNVKASERNKLAAVNDAEAAKIRTIADAEARKEALRLDGEGIAAQRKAIFQNYAEQFNSLSASMSEERAYKTIMAAMDNDTLRDAGKHGNVIITSTGGNNQERLAELAALGKTGSLSGKPANDGQPRAPQPVPRTGP